MLAVPANEALWSHTEQGPAQGRADALAAAVKEEPWRRMSAGEGAKGPRLYDWGKVPLFRLGGEGWNQALLVRRRISQEKELASYVVFAPAETSLAELVRVAGSRWSIEECLESAKGEGGLDQYEGRRWEGGYRYITLALVAHAYLALLRHQAEEAGGKGERSDEGASDGLLPLTLPEVRRLLGEIVWGAVPRGDPLPWSRWRRHPQAVAKRCHYRTRLKRSAPDVPL